MNSPTKRPEAESAHARKRQAQTLKQQMYGAVNLHDHAGGLVACAACQAERVGGLTWSEFVYDVMMVLGACKPSKTDAALNLRRVQAMGVDLEDAKEYWVRNFSGAAYVELRPQLKLPPDERKRLWNGMAPCGKHSADFEGQQCHVCPRPVVRLFDDNTEKCNELGQRVSMHVRLAVDEMVKWLEEQEPDASMRDFETLVISHVQMVTARKIVMRRRPG